MVDAKPRKYFRSDPSSSSPVPAADFPPDLMSVLQDESFAHEFAADIRRPSPTVNAGQLTSRRSDSPPTITTVVAANPVIALQYKTRENPLHR